jgi:hypothetical protein
LWRSQLDRHGSIFRKCGHRLCRESALFFCTRITQLQNRKFAAMILPCPATFPETAVKKPSMKAVDLPKAQRHGIHTRMQNFASCGMAAAPSNWLAS